MGSLKKVLLDFTKDSKFVYGLYRVKSYVLAIFSKDNLEKSLDHDGYIALKRTCFYAEAGGQVSDTGMIIGKNFKARVVDVFKGPNGQNIHKVRLLDGEIKVNDDCELVVDKDRRRRIEANHSSVHLLQLALQQVVSKTIKQAGSYVDDERLRFDFTYSGKISDDDLVKVEEYVNNEIAKKIIVSTEVMPIDAAKELGAMALFNEKYGDKVRVVKIGKSIELCGGTHAANTSDIRSFAIYNFESKGSNTYRIEAATASRAEQQLFDVIKPYNDEMIKLLMKAKGILSEAKKEGIDLEFDVEIDNSKPVSYKDIIFNKNELSYIQKEVKDLEKKYNELKKNKSLENLDIYKNQIRKYNNISGIIMRVENEDINILKTVADSLVNEMDKGFVFFANVKDLTSVLFIARSNCSVNAGFIVKEASTIAGGNGGGSPTFAQGGGKTIECLDQIFDDIEKELENAE